MTRRLVVSAWLGLALAALFFYPLAVALDADIYYLQWQRADAFAALAALAALGLVLAYVIFVVWRQPTRPATAVLLGIAAIPLASFAAGVSRQLPFGDALRAMGERNALVFGVPIGIAAAGGLAFVIWPAGFGRWLRRLIVLVSPASLVVVTGLVASLRGNGIIVHLERPAGAAAADPVCGPVLALLFDELSFSYLYDERGNMRAGLPAFARLGANATHHLSVSAPGRETLSALPSFLAARRVRDIRVANDRLLERGAEGELVPFSATDGEGLFATARRLGFTTEIAGYYLTYCELLEDLVDRCLSLSFYNASSPRAPMSLADPLLTTLILWPRQFPFGLLKNPAFAVHQRAMVEDLVAFARRPLRGEVPVFRFVHFSVPHLPFVFGVHGYDPPFDPLQTSPDTAYVEQVQYVDRLIGDLTEQLRTDGEYDRATLVVFADHGYRFGGREQDPLHIPFIVKRPRQDRRVDVTAPVRGEVLLKRIVEDACEGE